MKKIVFGAFFILLSLGLLYSVSADEKYWIFFKDKGYTNTSDLRKIARQHLSEKAVQRRLLRGDKNNIFDETDLPVNQTYLEQIKDTGVKIHTISKWLNAVSIYANSAQLAALTRFYFVKKITPVNTFRRKQIIEQREAVRKSFLFHSNHGPTFFDYGPSLAQVSLINVPQLHDAGLSGAGVLITLLDSGFNYGFHRAFTHVDVLAERDFINHDGITRNEEGQDSPSQHNHGTQVLSVIGGYMPGRIIGPAYGATYAFAKTEYVPTETRIEEDNWVAGIEWADSIGTDIVTSSLGYLDFDGGFTYTYEDLDGQTMVTSVAASMAVQKGIVVVTSAGNEGNDKNWPYILSPADGIGVIAVGAVSSTGSRVSFSSIGPTADGRYKPDVMAMGLGNTVVMPNDSIDIVYGNGTSFAAPLVAGVCALLLESNPGWTPEDVYNALTTSASQSTNPDNYFGYGVVDAMGAANLGNFPGIPSDFIVYPAKINVVNEHTTFMLDVPENGTINLSIYNSLGQQVEKRQFEFVSGKRLDLLWQWPPHLSGGIYFAKFELNNDIKTQKIMIFR